MINYQALLLNIRLNKITYDIKKIKKFILDYGIGGEDKTPTKRNFTFQEVVVILAARNKYAASVDYQACK